MALPRLGTTSGPSPAMKQFLAAHPEFAKMTSVADRQRFLDNHPKIAAAYQQVIGTTSAAAPAAAAPAAPAAPAGPAPLTSEAASAKAALTAALDSYGLGSLGDWAWGQYLNGVPTEQIMLDLRQQPQYAQRFPGMAELSKKGRAVTEAEYISLERSYVQQARAYGLPEGFYDDPSDLAKLIGGEVSAQEWGDRLQIAQQAALTDPRGQAMRDFLSREYGVTNTIGAVTAYWIDPDKSGALIKQQAAAAIVAAEAATTGFGSLNKTQAERLGNLGVTADQARQGFSQLAALSPLQQALGTDIGSQAITQDDMLNATFAGDARAAEKIRLEEERRTAAFKSGGGFAAGQRGVTGLGSASS